MLDTFPDRSNGPQIASDKYRREHSGHNLTRQEIADKISWKDISDRDKVL